MWVQQLDKPPIFLGMVSSYQLSMVITGGWFMTLLHPHYSMSDESWVVRAEMARGDLLTQGARHCLYSFEVRDLPIVSIIMSKRAY